MNTKFLYTAVAILFVLVIYLTIKSFVHTDKFAYVQTGKILAEYVEMKKVKKELEKRKQTFSAQIDTLSKDLQLQLKNYEKQSVNMNEREKKMALEILENKRRQFFEYQQVLQQKSSQEEQSLTAPIIQEINTYIETYGKAQGYRIVFGTSNGNIVYAEVGSDITEDVLKGLNNSNVK